MAKKVKKVVKKVVNKVLDSTELDEKIIAEYNENKPMYDMILCHIKCYGGYIVAIGAGCVMGVNLWLGLGMVAASLLWGWKVTCGCKLCKEGSCCKN
tara:strand:+ start:367 stop:657 length:291 start_codon:yes stop_codon:yes gene_type:complete